MLSPRSSHLVWHPSHMKAILALLGPSRRKGGEFSAFFVGNTTLLTLKTKVGSLMWNQQHDSRKRQWRIMPTRTSHYDSIAVYLCLSEMGNTAGNCSLKAPFIPVGISFGSHRKRGAQLRFLSFQKR